MSGAAQYLASHLDQVLGAERHDVAEHWGDTLAMARSLDQVRRQHERASGRSVAADKIALAVAAFRASGRVANFVELKHVCLGAGTLDAAGLCLLADDALRTQLLALAETVPTARRQVKCFQSLLRCYWAFPRHDEDLAPAAIKGFAALRAWLQRRYAELRDTPARKPTWFATLTHNANLLSPQPCDRYAPALLQGDAAELQLAVDGLSIPGDSWVKEEAVLAQLREAARLDDADWLQVLPPLLDLATGKAGIAVPPALARRCIGLAVQRHARCATPSVHAGLLDAALEVIGNPWLRRAAWDAHVLEADQRPAEHARAMINSWLKQGLIADFFALHGSDPGGRRGAYWQKFDPFIQALWIGLGPAGVATGGAAAESLRRRAKGCLLLYDETMERDNVLILRIGAYLALEFGAAGRPLHLLRWQDLEPLLAKRLSADRGKKYFDLAGLLLTRDALCLEHRDGTTADTKWEQRFDARIRPLVWQGTA